MLVRRFRYYAAAPMFAAIAVVNAARLYTASLPVTAVQLGRDCAVMIGLTLLVAFILALLPGADRTKGAALSLGVLVLGAYPRLAGLVDVAPSSWADAALGFSTLALLTTALWAVARWRREVLDSSHQLLCVLLALVCVYSAYAVIVRRDTRRNAKTLEHLGGAPLRLPDGPRAPDIIHVIFDGLGRLDVLQQSYGLDASSIASRLSARSTAVDEAAVANYSQTYPAIAAALSMAYLDDIVRLGKGGNDRTLAEAAIYDSTVIRALKRRGYSFTLLSSGYEALIEHPSADGGIYGPTLFNEFESYLLPRTPLRMVPAASMTYEPQRRRTIALLQALESFQPGPRPQFLLAHLLLPHPPFTFGPGGCDIRPARIFSIEDGNAFQGSTEEYRSGYASQARYVFEQLERLLAHWEKLSPRPIVIIHGDHGPGLGYDIGTPGLSDVRDRMRIFLAVQSPLTIEPIGSPVNIYRHVFRAAFGVELPSLADRSFVSSWSRPYDFTEVNAR